MGLPRVTPGEEIRADDLNALFAAAEGLELSVAGDLEMASSPGGRAIVATKHWAAWVKISSGSNPYSWAEQVPRSAGTWATGRSGTSNAYESNAVTTVPANTYVWLRYEPASGDLRFTY